MHKSLILAVDDDKHCLMVLECLVREMGLDILSTPDARETMTLIEKHHPSIVILDVVMPDLNGFQLCRLIKESHEFRHIPVIFITGLESIDDKVLGFESDYQPDAILTKPVKKERLQITLRSMQRIHDQYHEYAEQYDNLIKLEELRDNLINMLAHDMRHPIQSIYGYCAFLDGSLPFRYSDSQLATNIKNHAFRLNQMIENFIDVGRLECHKMPIFWEEITIASVLDKCIDRMLSAAHSNQIELISKSNDPDFIFLADEMICGRILDNLVSNAIKFSPKWAKITVAGDFDEEKNGLILSVEDKGPGIDDEYKEVIFRKFGASALQKIHRKPSVGIGLSFCKLAAASHGGDVWVEDAPEVGSIFKVFIPLYKEAPEYIIQQSSGKDLQDEYQ